MVHMRWTYAAAVTRPTDAASVTIADIDDAAQRLRGIIRPTPTQFADSISRALGREIALKPEHTQRAGSFKIRGAYNRISRLPPGEEVVAGSAGNHAQGVALASSLTKRHSTIYMPEAASLPKINATQEYGARVVVGGSTVDDCIVLARAHSERTGAVFVPPFDDPLVIAGQGTVGLELANELQQFGWFEKGSPTVTVLIPIGGGGLIAGTALALRSRFAGVRIIGVEAEGAASMRRSLDAHTVVRLDAVSTMADGIALKAPSLLTFTMTEAFVDDVVTVTEEEISQAVLLLVERAKAVVEPSGAVGLAALMSGRVPDDGPAAVVLSGGNVDPLLLTNIVGHGLSAAGRYLRLRIVAPDRPGSLAALTAAVARLGLNVLDVEHHRTGVALGVNEVEMLLTVETRSPGHRDQILSSLTDAGFRAELL